LQDEKNYMVSILRHGSKYAYTELCIGKYTSCTEGEEEFFGPSRKKDTFVGYKVFHMDIDCEE
jgi:hypothetical protein